MAREFPTVWNAWVQRKHADGRLGTSWSVCGSTLPAFFADAFRTATFAVVGRDATSINDGSTYFLTQIARECVACSGTGTMRAGKRIVRTVPCSACKGAAVAERMDDIPLELHENIRDDLADWARRLRAA